jgi:predicted DNA-binding protein
MTHTMSKRKPSDRSSDRHLPYKLIRVPDELYRRLKELADKNDRPISRELKRALEAHLRSQEGQQQ